MAWRILNRPLIYRTLGMLLLSAGITLSCFLGSRLTREAVDGWVAEQSNYLLIASTPVFRLPPATPLPTLTPTPIPTATPPPLPAIRLSIPAINLNTTIEETFPTTITTWTGRKKHIWSPVSYAVGHYSSSGYPTEGTNIVLAGHNNTKGAVFRRLSDLDIGDEVILFTEDNGFHYRVQEKVIIPYLGAEAKADAKLRFYAAPKPTEMVTLISCWPYATNADRIVVIAVPASEEDERTD